jgi:hypothetical protein
MSGGDKIKDTYKMPHLCFICVSVIADPGVTFIADPKKPGDDHLLVHAASLPPSV